MGSFRRVRAVLGINRDDILGLLQGGKAILSGLSDHPDLFVDPQPKIGILQGKILSLEQSQQLATTRVKGACAARDAKAVELMTALETARAYVQSLADENPEKAKAIIEAAAMYVAAVGTYKKPLLEATQDVPGGPVLLAVNVGALTAEAMGKVLYEWQMSSDGGTTWGFATPTTHGHTELDGLTVGQSYEFRVRFCDTKGAHAWTQTFTYVVV